jgi:tetratricopeptide (TPR) repeat protein
MAGRVPLAALVLAAALAAGAAPALPPSSPSPRPVPGAATVLVRYGFDDDAVDTGPDTFAVFRAAHGRVGLSTAFRVSGYRSVEISDVHGNGDFSELQGYFPEQRGGHVFAHFALLTARPDQELDVALAGPRHFQLGKDGIAFWLSTREGRFVHVSDSIPRKLAPVRGFVWYTVDVAYDVDRGRYDLAIREEGSPEPVVDLRDQPGAASQARSAVDVFSFVSDPTEDASDVTYYVDDVSIATSRAVVVPPLVAPGRRKLFVDAFAELRRAQDGKPRCLPATTLADLGIVDTEALGTRGLALLEQVLASEGAEGASALPADDARRLLLQAAAQWREGCRALEAGDAAGALERFERAGAAAPAGRIYALDAALALIVLGRTDEASDRLAAVAADWTDDPRYAIVAAREAAARGDLVTARETLRPAAERGDAAAAERYYSLLLWDRRWAEARELALGRARATSPAGATWLERAGDAAFEMGEAAEARDLYEEAARLSPDQPSLFLKLSDAAFVLKDFEAERRYRERYYGSLTAP